MINVPVTYAKLCSVLSVHSLSLFSGSSLDTVKKSLKSLRRVRDAAIDFEEALKMKQTEFQKMKVLAGEDPDKLAELALTEAKFIEEVKQANKDTVNLEVEKSQLEALKEVLSKSDWTSSECKEAINGKKLTQFDMMNVDEFVEDIEKALQAE